MVTLGVPEHMTLKSSGCPSDGYREPLLYGNGEFKSSLLNLVDSSASLNLSAINSMHSMPALKDDGHLYKRRKMDDECDVLLTDGNMRERTSRKGATFGKNSSCVQNGYGKSHTIPSKVPVPNSGVNTVASTIEYEEHAEASNGDIQTASLESRSSVDDRWSSSVLSMTSSIDYNINDAGDCSSPDTKATKPMTEQTAVGKLCISRLKSDEHLNDGSEPSSISTSIVLHDNGSNHLFLCKTCGFMEDPLKMLICDYCEGAFHLSCCRPQIMEIPSEEWYCLGCSNKKPKRLSRKSLNAKKGSSDHIQRPRRGLSPIEYMLIDVEPYETEVRIGRDFQAEVPEWCGPISSSDGYFDEPSELNPTEASNLTCSKRSNGNKPSIGNWIQCREVLHTGVVCGKWRRAPLFVIQSSNWDCSCSVLWDPIHADCAVPQERRLKKFLSNLSP